jgi:hypothetical protein
MCADKRVQRHIPKKRVPDLTLNRRGIECDEVRQTEPPAPESAAITIQPALLMRPRRRLRTLGGTSPATSPPKLKTSLSMRELTNE